MANGTFLILVCVTIVATFAFPHPEVEVITQPKPGEEYVFVQTSGSGARPIARKDKHKNEERPFETAHKFPPSLTYILNHDDAETKIDTNNKHHKREASPGEAPAPAPAGAIKLDVQKLLEKYKTVLKTSTTQSPKQTTKSSRRGGTNKRIKKDTKEQIAVTSPVPILTTGAAAPKQIDDDIPLVASGSEKQRSRIQIKKAPNGQEYEYEYVYYYYDDDDDKKVSNSHDGPARNQKWKEYNKGRPSVEKTSATPDVNEVVPSSSKGRTRGRQLGEEEVGEERLPANTRFPPRSRNLNTTPLPEEETKATRGRGRGRSTTEAAPSAVTEADNVSDETQGSRGRTRANVRRPSLELVDNASFNTHSNTAGAEPSGISPSFPTDLPAGPVRFLGATPNESVDPPEPIRKSDVVPDIKSEESATNAPEEDGTTVMSPMDKVALDLYAILQGTQKLSGEDVELSTEDNLTDGTNEAELTTLEATTELIIETTTPTTTTTTTTTTPAPTTATTTTTEQPIGRGRFNKGRGRKTTHAASTTEATHTETKPKSKFSRPSFGGRPRPGARTTTESSIEQEASKEEVKPASHSRPTLSRSRFGASRTRTRTTAAPSESQEESSSSTSAPSARPSLTRPRSSFNLRTRGRTTAAPTESDSSGEEETASSSESVSTTVRTRKIQAGSAVRPLRPGPRINLARGRPGQSTTTTEEPVEDHVTGDEEPSNSNTETSEEKEPETSAAPVDNSPLGRLKNKHRVNVQARPKAAASAPVQVRRINPLLARRRPGQAAEPSSSETPQESISTEAAAEAEETEETEAPATSSTTTEEPRGLNKLLAGRRRLASRAGAHH